MLKISDFARLAQVTVRALRYYDQLGLLKPVHVDEATGYRYYAAAQLPRLNRILVLKDLGLSLEQIAPLLAAETSLSHLRGMLQRKQAELQQHIHDEQARLRRVEVRLRQIEREDTMPTYDVLLKHVAPIQVAGVRVILPTHGDVHQLFTTIHQRVADVYAYLDQQHVSARGPALTIWQEGESEVDGEVAVPVSEPVSGNGDVIIHTLSAIETMASVVHHGSLLTIGDAYCALQTWVAAQHYQPIGPYREVFVHAGTSLEDEASVMEIQLPVAKETRLDQVQDVLMPDMETMLSTRARTILPLAIAEAQAMQHPAVEPMHILLGLIREQGGVAAGVLNDLGVRLAQLRQLVTDTLHERVERGQAPVVTEHTRRIYGAALAKARQHNHDYIGTEHLLLGLLEDRSGGAVETLARLGIAAEQIQRRVLQILGDEECM